MAKLNLFTKVDCAACEILRKWFGEGEGEECLRVLQNWGHIEIMQRPEGQLDPDALADLDMLDVFEFPTLVMDDDEENVVGIENIQGRLRDEAKLYSVQELPSEGQ